MIWIKVMFTFFLIVDLDIMNVFLEITKLLFPDQENQFILKYLK